MKPQHNHNWLLSLFISLFLISFNSYANNTTTNCTIEKESVPYVNNNYHLYLEKIIANNCSNRAKAKYPDILLIHGLTYSSHQFDLQYKDYSLANFLAKNGFRVWLLDITGYGRSQKPQNGFIVNGDYAAKDIAGAVNLIRNNEHVSKLNLLGWSFGTISGSRMVKAYPEWINSLILYAPIYHGKGLPTPTKGYQAFSDAAALSDFQINSQTKQIIASIAESPVVQQYLAQCRQYDGMGSVNGCRKDLFQPSQITLFDPKALTMPVLIIAGTNDPYVNWQHDIPYLSKVMPNKNNAVIKIDGASHILMLEQPYYHFFQNSVLHFLRDNN